MKDSRPYSIATCWHHLCLLTFLYHMKVVKILYLNCLLPSFKSILSQYVCFCCYFITSYIYIIDTFPIYFFRWFVRHISPLTSPSRLPFLHHDNIRVLYTFLLLLNFLFLFRFFTVPVQVNHPRPFLVQWDHSVFLTPSAIQTYYLW